MPPGRRALYVSALVFALLGVIKLFRGFSAVDLPFGTPFFQIWVLTPVWEPGTFVLVLGFPILLFALWDHVATERRIREGWRARHDGFPVARSEFTGPAVRDDDR